MVVDLTRKLAQDPRNRIAKVVWSPLGGMLWLYVNWSAKDQSGGSPPNGVARVTGLPDAFGDFDIFSAQSSKADTDPASQIIQANLNEPISDAALNKFLYWAKHPAINSVKTVPSGDSIVYYATQGPEYDAVQGFEIYPYGVSQCGTPITYIAAAGGSFLDCLDSVVREINAGSEYTVYAGQGYGGDQAAVQEYCNGCNWWFNRNAWGITFRVAALALGTGKPVSTRDHSAIIALNIKKLRKYQPANAQGSKADELRFLISANDFPNTSTKNGDWSIEGWTISAKVPPNGSGIRSFPLASDTLRPTWGSPDASAAFSGPTGEARVEVTLKFSTLELFMVRRGSETPPTEG